MALGPYLSFDGYDYECTLCCRYFATESALYAHCQNTSCHEWCQRCWRVFRSFEAKQSHINGSSAHWICSLCDHRPDFSSWGNLNAHQVAEHYPCSVCGTIYRYKNSLLAHRKQDHHPCDKCDECFWNQNNLRMHKQRHQTRNLGCYGRNCHQEFKTFSGMLIHLESGACGSRIIEDDLDNEAFRYSFAAGFGNYECPSCDKRSFKLSALYQHAEDTPSCSYLLEYPKILFYFQKDLRSLAQRGQI